MEDVNAVILLANLCYVFHEFFKEKLRAAFTAGARGRLPTFLNFFHFFLTFFQKYCTFFYVFD